MLNQINAVISIHILSTYFALNARLEDIQSIFKAIHRSDINCTLRQIVPTGYHSLTEVFADLFELISSLLFSEQMKFQKISFIIGFSNLFTTLQTLIKPN